MTKSSLLSKAPALLILESCVLTFISRQTLSPGRSIFLTLSIIVLQLCVTEEIWSFRKCTLSVIILLLSFPVSLALITDIEKKEPLMKSIHGTFSVASRRHWGERALLTVIDEDGRSWLALARYELEKAQEGDRFSCSATVRPLRKNSRRSSFSPYKYWRSRGVLGELHDLRSVTILPSHFSVHTIRRYLRARLKKLPPASRALSAAVLLGDRENNIAEDFRRWGISHFLAVSGWHVSFALVLAVFMAGKHKAGLYTASCLLWLYCFLSGSSVSAVRAAIMLQIGLCGLLLGMGTSALNGVGVAGTIMLILEPWVFYDLGWQMSVLAALVAVTLQRINNIWPSLFSSLVMWIVVSPLTASIAGGIYLSSLPINIMASALFSFILLVMLFLSLMTMVSPVFLSFAAETAELLYRLWSLAADQWCVWLPQALPVGFFQIGSCAALVFLLIGFSLKIKVWRSALLAVIGGTIFAYLG